MFIVLHAFLPNKQSWSYKWFFHTVLLPALLGKDVLKRIKIIVTIGNSQEISQLDDAIAMFFLMPIGSGALGILSRGWHKKVKVALGGKSRKKRAIASLG
jgi:hypothetical protein